MPGDELGSFFIGLDVDLSGLQASLKTAATQLNEAANKMTGSVEKMANTAEAKMKKLTAAISDAGKKMKDVGTAISTIGVPLGLAGAAAIKLGMDAVESENLFSVSMGGMAKQAREFSETLRANLGLNAYEVRKQVGTFNVMVDSMGVGTDKAYEMATGLTQLTYDMASFYNLKPEEAFIKLQAGISGEIEPLKRLGIVITEDMVKQRALTDGTIKQGEELSIAQKSVIRYNLILEKTGKAQGDMARTLDSPANKLRILQEQIKNTAIDLGMALMPAFESLLSITKPIVAAISQLVTWFSQLPVPIRNIVAGLGALIAISGPVLIYAGYLTEAFSKVLPILNSLWSLIVTKIIPAFTSFQVAIGPIGWAIEGVILAAGLLWLAWKNNFGNIQEHFAKFKAGMVDAFKKWIDSMKTMFGGFGKILQGIWKMITGDFKTGWALVKKGGADVAKGYAGQWSAQFDVIKTTFKEGTGFIIDSAKSMKSGLDKVMGGTSGIKAPAVKAAATVPAYGTVSPTGLTPITKSGKAGESAFEQAKKLYEMDIVQTGITSAQKLAIYKKYLADVKKTDDEKYEYEKQLKEFSVDIAKEEAEEKERLQKATFEDAKDKYEMDILQAGITTDEKLRLYKKYLDGVKKTAEQEKEYQRQLKEFSVQQKEEEIAKKKAEDEAYKNYVSGYTNQIANLFRQGLDAMLDGTLTFQNALQAVWTTVRDMFLDVVTKMFQDWLKAEIAKRAQAMLTTLVMQTQGKSALLALGGVLGAAASALISAVGSVGMTVLSMMGSIGAAIAAIPGAGWVMGGLIIAGVAAAIGKISGLMSKANEATTTAIPAFAEGTMEIGQSGLAMVHSGETILPAKSAEKFRESGGGMGGTEISVSMPIQAIDSKDFKNHLADNVRVVTDEIRKQMRYGKF